MANLHYDIKPLLAHNADINIIFGERSNGKSYQAKMEVAFKNYFEKGERFVLLRRHKTEISSTLVEGYFADMDIKKLTNGKYNSISYYRKQLYLAFVDPETMKVSKGEKIGYVFALSQEQIIAGMSLLDVTTIIFEEFMSRTMYLAQEWRKLSNIYSTIDRKRGTVKIFLIGNTITRVNPIIRDLDLMKVVQQMKQGDIKIVEAKTASEDEERIKIALEYCRYTGKSSHVIGKNTAMINNGSWQVDNYPNFPILWKLKKPILTVGFNYQGFKFLGRLVNYNDTQIWLIFPKASDAEFKNVTCIFTDTPTPSAIYFASPYATNIPSKIHAIFRTTFVESNIYYANDQTGTDFNQTINFEIRE